MGGAGDAGEASSDSGGTAMSHPSNSSSAKRPRAKAKRSTKQQPDVPMLGKRPSKPSAKAKQAGLAVKKRAVKNAASSKRAATAAASAKPPAKESKLVKVHGEEAAEALQLQIDDGDDDRPQSAVADVTEAMGRQLHNDDYCGNCGIGGGLICCDRCPLAFHVLCCNPPLDPDNLPDGEWLCARCSPREMGPSELRDVAEIPDAFQSITERFLRKNPIIFKPPRHIIKPFQDQVEQADRKRMYGSQQWEQDKLCYKCGSEPAEHQRMRCTHCPLVYHVDCLPEPVTAVIVKGAWMCPNHAERVMSRRKKARLSVRRTLESTADARAIKLDFITKMAQERRAEPAAANGGAGPAVAAVQPEATEAEKRAFAESLVRMHEEWWTQERVSLGVGSGGGRVAVDERVAAAAARMPATVALGADIAGMSDEERQAAILRLRRLVNADVREATVARAQLNTLPPRKPAPVSAPAEFPKRECPDGCIATLRCTSSGEVFFVMPDDDFVFGRSAKAAVDLDALGPAQTPDDPHSVIVYNKRTGDLELLHVSENSSAFLNGEEVTADGKRTLVVPDSSVLEICGLKFAVERTPTDGATPDDAGSSSSGDESDDGGNGQS